LFARSARDSKTIIAVLAPRARYFSLLAQRKVPKRKRARVAHRAQYARFPALLAKPGARLTRRPPTYAARARSKGSRLPPASLRCSVRDTGGEPTHLEPWHGCSFSPRMARRASQPVPGEVARPVFEPGARILRPASWGARRGPARSARGSRAIRGRVSLVTFFARAKKVTQGAGAEPPASSF
jgi:hypothetical protein